MFVINFLDLKFYNILNSTFSVEYNNLDIYYEMIIIIFF